MLRAAGLSGSQGFYPICGFVIDLYWGGSDKVSARNESFREWGEKV